ncbi:MAG: lysylphosphatidylglycerol synthase transmembrane domain-containing protein [Bacteroidales bacterium]
MKKKINIVLNFIVFPSLAILLLYLAFKGIDISTLWTELLKADYKWIFISLAFALGGFFFRALRWRLLLQASNQNPPIQTTFYAVIMAYFANIAIPRMGEVTRCATLKKTNDIPFDISFGTVITERIVDLITLLIVIFTVLILDFSFFSSFFLDNAVNPVIEKFNFSSILILILVFLTLMIVKIVFFRKQVSEWSFTKKIKAFTQGLLKGLFSVFHLKKIWLFLFYTTVIWLCYSLMTYVVFFAIPSTSHLTLTDSLFVLSIGGLGMSAPVQNGFGAFHWIVSRGLMLFGISQADGLLYATLCHESQTLMVLILGPITMLMIFLYNKNQKK